MPSGVEFHRWWSLAFDKLKKEEAHVDESIRLANKMLHVYKWLAKAEKKTARGDGQLDSLLSELEQKLSDKAHHIVPTMKSQLSVADKKLEKLASFYKGAMRMDLKEIELEEELLRSFENKEHGAKGAGAIKLRLEREIQRLESDLKELLQWINTNITLVKIIQKWAADLEAKTK
ncbi:hypothetical protein HYT55_03720 [Candidatus Woesearchaeota archaeon]|nr:hypothetical protein [Candidatus Woesearchaeota archaeon]